MKKIFCSTLMLLFAASICFAGTMENYSVVQETTQKGETKKMIQKMYMTPDKTRMEMTMPMPHAKGSMIIITRSDKDVYWTIFEANKTYFEQPMDNEKEKELLKTFDESETIEELGTEKILGYKCKIQKIQTVHNIMGQEIKSTLTIWKCDEIPFPLKVVTDDGAISEVKEINKGKQPDTLFELPEGLKKTNNMMEAMGMNFDR